MGMVYQNLRSKPKILQSLTVQRPSEFEHLLNGFEGTWQQFVAETFLRAGRHRHYGGGRKVHLASLAGKQLFILVCFRLYSIQVMQGYLFGMSQAQANVWVHRLTCVLNQALGREQYLPKREPTRLGAVLDACPELEFMIDGTERPINCPKDKAERKNSCSGKKKAHSVKNLAISQRWDKVVFLSDTYEGKKHDKKIADVEGYGFSSGSLLW